MIEVMLFTAQDCDTISDNINGWLEKNPDIKIIDIKQSALPPDACDPEPEKNNYKPDIFSFIVISIWYEKRSQKDKSHIKKSLDC
jgi:hypothetical protein